MSQPLAGLPILMRMLISRIPSMRKAALYGTDETYLKNLAGGIEEGAFPQNDREAVLSSNARFALDVNLGDSVTLQTPAGSREFTISGFGSDDQEYYEGRRI